MKQDDMNKQAGPGGRPRMSDHERRCRQSKIRLTIAELDYLRAQARTAGMPVAEFVRRRALALPVQPPPSHADARLLSEINALGVNLNQIARNSNAGREGIQAVDWSDLQAELSRVLEKIGAAL